MLMVNSTKSIRINKAKNTAKGLGQELECLILIARFRWLRIQECAMFLWPQSPKVNRYQYSMTLFKKLEQKKLVFLQKMPNHAGIAAVLTIKGAKMVRYHKVFAKGTTLSINHDGEEFWQPNKFWKHDLRAVGLCAVLVNDRELTHENAKFWTELQVSKMNIQSTTILSESSVRIPDLMIETKFGIWAIEVENSRKSGQKQRAMTENAFFMNKEEGFSKHSFDNVQPNLTVFAINKNETEYVKSEEKSYPINHFKDILMALYKESFGNSVKKVIFPVFFLDISNFGVVGYKYETEEIDFEVMDPTL